MGDPLAALKAADPPPAGGGRYQLGRCPRCGEGAVHVDPEIGGICGNCSYSQERADDRYGWVEYRNGVARIDNGMGGQRG